MKIIAIQLFFWAALFWPNYQVEAWSIVRLSSPYEDLQIAGWDMFSRDKELQFDVDYSNCDITEDELNSAIDQAFETWNKIPYSGIRLVRGDEVSSSGGSDPPSIFCDNDGSNGIPGDGVAGIGGPTAVDTGTGIITAGRLVLNSIPSHTSRLSNQSEVKRAVVIAHEIGHVMGFGHSSDQSALMYYDASEKENLRLSQDDIDVVMYMYPRDEFGPDAFLGCGSVDIDMGDPTGGKSASALFVLLVMISGWLATRRRRSLV